MKRFHWLTTAALSCSLVLGCSDDAGNEAGDGGTSGDGDGDTGGACEAVQVDADIEADTTWTADKCYVLTSLVTVNGATLTIEPGTTIKGVTGSALVIEKDAMLIAEGTADAPIVFTSNEASPTSGDWGGLVLLGTATTNIGTGQAEGFPVPPTYGGSDDAHNCGTLKYVRVEYAGYAISDGNELNGITFYACGTDTTVSHVQSHMGLDDGIECFGGGFDMDHMVITGANDDSIDMDQGFHGTIQHVFIQQNPAVGDSCFEVSNQATNFDAVPKTAPTICNATCIGSGSSGEKSKGVILKEAPNGQWYANIFVNPTQGYTLLADDATYAEVDGGNIMIGNNMFFGNAGADDHVSQSMMLDTAGWTAWVQDPAMANQAVDPGLASSEWGAPDPTPSADVSGNGEGCGGTSYIGAVDPAGDNWTAEPWINYVP